MPRKVFQTKLKSAEILILRQVDYGDHDKIISFLTKDKGKKSGILHGIKKNKSSHLGKAEPLTQGKIFYQERSTSALVQIKKFETITCFHSLYSEYQTLVLALYCAELIEYCEFPEHESNQIFSFLAQTLQKFVKDLFPKTVKIIFDLNLLQLLGIAPNLTSCSCGQCLTAVKVFQLDCTSGTLRCHKCSPNHKHLVHINSDTLFALANLSLPIPQTLYSQWDIVFHTYLQFHYRRTLKSRKLLFSA